MGALREALECMLDALLPQRCAGCGAAVRAPHPVCPSCRAAIPALSFGLCARCLAHGREPVGCMTHPHFTVWPAWVYDRRAEAIVHALKYQGLTRVAETVGPDLARAAAHLGGADFVVELPLHPARRRERGYNQSALLADALSRALGVPRLEGLLRRTRPTRAQARLGPGDRRRNVRGAFRVEHAAWVRERQVVVVDDVITTGATFEACLEPLIEAGARPCGVALAWAQ